MKSHDTSSLVKYAVTHPRLTTEPSHLRHEIPHSHPNELSLKKCLNSRGSLSRCGPLSLGA